MKCDLKLSSLIQLTYRTTDTALFEIASCMDVENVLDANYLFRRSSLRSCVLCCVKGRKVHGKLFPSTVDAFSLVPFIFGFQIDQKTQFIFIIFNFQLNADNAAVYDTVIFAGPQPAGPMKQVKSGFTSPKCCAILTNIQFHHIK